MADDDSRANVTGCRIVTLTLIAAALTFLLIASPTLASMWEMAREVIHDALDGAGTLTACEGLEPAECVALAQEGRP